MTELEDFGSIVILDGECKGMNGYYDDYEYNEDGELVALVYLGEPFNSELIEINHNHIKRITVLFHEKWKKDNKEFCDKMGI